MCNVYASLVFSQVLTEAVKLLGVSFHPRGTMVCVEGPRFSSRAESLMFRQWGADVINMTTVPEVVLAKEMGLCYAAIAMATDYDCWKEHEEPVRERFKILLILLINELSLQNMYSVNNQFSIHYSTCTASPAGSFSWFLWISHWFTEVNSEFKQKIKFFCLSRYAAAYWHVILRLLHQTVVDGNFCLPILVIDDYNVIIVCIGVCW